MLTYLGASFGSLLAWSGLLKGLPSRSRWTLFLCADLFSRLVSFKFSLLLFPCVFSWLPPLAFDSDSPRDLRAFLVWCRLSLATSSPIEGLPRLLGFVQVWSISKKSFGLLFNKWEALFLCVVTSERQMKKSVPDEYWLLPRKQVKLSLTTTSRK